MLEKVPRAKYGPQRMMEGKEEKPVDIPMQYPRTMGPNCMNYLQEVVDSGLTVDMVGRFEKAFAKELGVKHCIATPGCTPALATLAAAFDFEPGDEIINSPIADYGTLQGLVTENYIPVFADAAPGTVNLSAETIAPCITDRTRAILVVHMTGIICDMDPINELAEKHGLIVYEDACQAIFSQYKGRLAGTLGTAAGFSFDSEKTMGSDIGGCVVTDDDDLAERVRFYGQSRGAQQEPHFGRRHVALGYAYRMTQCTAAICLAQLEIVREQVVHRDKMVRLLTDLIAEIPGITPIPIPDYLDVYSCWMFGFTINPDQFTCDAEGFAKQVQDAGVPMADIGKMYLMPAACTFLEDMTRSKTYPFSMPPASHEYSFSEDNCPNARDYLENFVYWPTFCEKYTEEICEQVAGVVRAVADRYRR